MIVMKILFGHPAGDSAPCVIIGRARSFAAGVFRPHVIQSGAHRFAFVALLLLALPVELTFHVLFALPRLAERKRQFCAFSLHPLFIFWGVPFPVSVVPQPDQVPGIDDHAAPEHKSFGCQMKQRFCDVDQTQKHVALHDRLLLQG